MAVYHTAMSLFQIYRLFDLNRTERLCINQGTSDDRGQFYDAELVYTDTDGSSHFVFAL